MKILYVIVAIAGIVAGILVPQYDIDKMLAAKCLIIFSVVAVGVIELFRKNSE